MQKSGKKNFILNILVSFIIFLLMLNISVLFLLGINVNAIIDMTSTIPLGKIQNDDDSFNIIQIQKLMEHLTGITGATYKDLLKSASERKTSEDLRKLSINNNSELVITIAGLTWNIVYLSVNKQGEPIITLWLTDSNQLAEEYSRSVWNGFSYNLDGQYPANMYGTSWIRAVALNNGGK